VIEKSENGGVVVLKLADGKANTMDIEFCQAMIDEFTSLRTSSAKAVVLTGQGNIFSAGVELVRTSDGGAAYVRTFLPALNAMFAAVYDFQKPVVAAINGHAIAGGCVLACCTDRRLMARGNGRIGVTELLVGLPFPALAFEVMRSVTLSRYLSQSIYAGETISPEVGAERGWIDEVVAPADLLDRATAAAQTLAALPAVTFAITKRQMHLPVLERMELVGDEMAVTEIWTAPEATARIQDYVACTFKKR
jgi:enoyl-CoA hydratase